MRRALAASKQGEGRADKPAMIGRFDQGVPWWRLVGPSTVACGQLVQ
jgi:hypothetical protein